MYIYKITNTINGKCYIGQDSGASNKLARPKSHFYSARRLVAGHTVKWTSVIANAIAKYGSESFITEILCDNVETKQELDDLERKLIKEHHSLRHQHGYNIRPGGEGLPPNDEITDPIVLKELYEMRSRGAMTRNKAYWEDLNAEERYERCKPMFKNRDSAEWSKTVKRTWDNMTTEEYDARRFVMSSSRKFRFELNRDGVIEVMYNLRTLLNNLPDDCLPMARKPLEKIIRTEGKFKCEQFEITRFENRKSDK